MSENRATLDLYDVLVIWIAVVSLAAVSLLGFHQFSSFKAVGCGTLLTVGLVGVGYRFRLCYRLPHHTGWLLLILLVALVFRAQPYLWVMGGQDQGLYVNMSAYYEKYGTPFITDNVRAALSDAAKREYDKTQHYLGNIRYEGIYPIVDIEGMKRQGIVNENVKHKNIYAMHTPGVFLKDMVKSEYVFQFYPLHPLWLSIGAKFFGSDNRVYSTVIFSLLSIISLYLLAIELAGGKQAAGLFVAAMLACNPLHAFFAKFPVTETLTLFFSATGFYYLARYYNRSLVGKAPLSDLVLSALLFWGLFFTRISGFFYLPLFYFILLAARWAEGGNSDRNRNLACYSLVILGSYLSSVWYGLRYSYPYTMNVHKGIFSWIMGENWLWVIAVVVLFAGACAWLAGKIRNPAVVRKYVDARRMTAGLAYLFLIGSTVAVLRAAYNVQQDGIAPLFSYTVMTCISYIGPVAFFFLYKAIKQNSCRCSSLHLMLVVFWLLFFVPIVLGWPLVKYQFYFARYLHSEIVPYALLLVAIYWSTFIQKDKLQKISIIMVTVTCLFFVTFSMCQLRGVEADGAAQALQVIKSKVDEKSLLLLGFDDLRLQTSLQYYFNVNTYRADRRNAVAKAIYPELTNKFAKVYLLTKAPMKNYLVSPVAEIAYREGQYEHASHIPTHFSYVNECTLYLYEIDKDVSADAVALMLAYNKVLS